MCKVDYYIDVYPDGTEKRRSRVEPCSTSRSYTCQDAETFHHPKTYVALPPSPRLSHSGSPRLDAPIVYHSNSESDHSRRSGRHRDSTLYFSSSPHRIEVSHSRSPGGSGSRYLHPHDSHDRHHRRSRYRLSTTEPQRPGERVVIVENPPTPRTPPQNISMPYTAPSSPLNGFLSSTPPDGRRSSRRGQPVIVDERPRVRFNEVPEEGLSSRRRRVPEPVITTTEERPRRRREATTTAAAAAAVANNTTTASERERAERIARLNDRINARPAVPIPIPIPSANPTLRRSTTGFAPVVDEGAHERELREALRQLDLGDRVLRRSDTVAAGQPSSSSQQRRDSRRDLYDRYGRRYVDEGQDDEEEAQRRRLAERMMPRRRATVGPGARRNRVLYDDGMYRWE